MEFAGSCCAESDSECRATAEIVEGAGCNRIYPNPGAAARPIEQIIIAQEFPAGRVKRPNMGIAAWIIPSIVAFGTDERATACPPRSMAR